MIQNFLFFFAKLIKTRVREKICKAKALYLWCKYAYMPAKIHPLTDNLNWTGKTAIVLEDDFVSYKIIEKYLMPTRIRLLWAKNADQALQFCESARPDIALVDIRLPGMNGIAFTRLLKEREAAIPVIIQTAYGLTESRRECQVAGCDGFLAKPYGQNLLLWRMMELLN